MFNLITIVDKSKIIREGLTSLLRTHGIAVRIAHMEKFDDWAITMGSNVPDVVIVAPDQVKDGVDKIKSKYHLDKKTLFVGIIYHYYSLKEVTETFDEAIYITDSEEVFVNKFSNLFSNQGDTDSLADSERLTDREKDVLRLLLRGYSNKEVADRLTISPHTVITHRKNIIEKTGIRSLAGLAVYAILNNIAEMDDLKK